MIKKSLIVLVIIFAILIFPYPALAHEVYVLTTAQIQHNLQVASLNVFSPLSSFRNIAWFLFFAMSAVTTLTISFFVSFSRWGIFAAAKVEKLSHFALPLIRIVFGISLIYSAYHSSLFGPELPLAHIVGGSIWIPILYSAGVLVILGLFTRIVAVILLSLFFLSVVAFHEYMFMYVNYLGEMLVLLLVKGDAFSLDSVLFKRWTLVHIKETIAIPILRISFAVSLLYAALYVKFFHPALAYEVVRQYHLDKFFLFDPLFVVLGAGCVEVVIALLFLFGVNMRWNILFFTFWATLSLLFFGEAVWPHYILFGIAIGLFLYGYDRFTLERWLVLQSKKLFMSK